MRRDLLGSLEVIRFAAEEIRRDQWHWQDLRELQKLRWRPSLASHAPPAQLRDSSGSSGGQ
jgi:hypothetical protein